MTDRRLTNEQVGQLTKRANQIEYGDLMDDFSTNAIQDSSANSMTTVMQVFLPLLPAVLHHLGGSTTEISLTFIERMALFVALCGNPSTGKTPALKLVSSACYEVERAMNVVDEDSKLANAATIESTIQLLSEKGSVLSLYDEGSTFLGGIGRYNPSSVALERAVYLDLYNVPEKHKRSTKLSTTTSNYPQLNIVLMCHPYLFVNLIRDELISLNDGLSHRFIIACPAAQDFDVTNLSLVSAKVNQRPEVSIVSAIYLIKRLCDTPVKFTLSKEAFERFDELHIEFRRITMMANKSNDFLPAAQFGKADTQLIRVATAIHALCFAINHLRSIPGSNNSTVSMEFIKCVNTELSEMRESFGVIHKQCIDYGFNLISGGFKTKFVFANLSEFNERERDIFSEMHRFLSRNIPIERPLIASRLNSDSNSDTQSLNQSLSAHSNLVQTNRTRVFHEFDEYQIKQLKRVLLIKSSKITTVDCNVRFRMSKMSAIECFKTFERLEQGKFIEENGNVLASFQKLEKCFAIDNYKLSLTLTRLEINLCDFIQSYPVFNYGSSCSTTVPSENSNEKEFQVVSSKDTPIIMIDEETNQPCAGSIKSRNQSVGGLDISFNSMFAFDDNSIDELIAPYQKPLKTKSTSFMIEQGKEKTSKTNENLITDEQRGASDLMIDCDDADTMEFIKANNFGCIKTNEFSCYNFSESNARKTVKETFHESTAVAAVPSQKYSRGTYKKKVAISPEPTVIANKVPQKLKKVGRPRKIQSDKVQVPACVAPISEALFAPLEKVKRVPRSKSAQTKKCETQEMKQLKAKRSKSAPNPSRCKQNKNTIGCNLKYTSDMI